MELNMVLALCLCLILINSTQFSRQSRRHQLILEPQDIGEGVDQSIIPIVVPHHSKPLFSAWTNSNFDYTAYFAVVHDPLHLSVALPDKACDRVRKTSWTAQEEECKYAINGGFFDMEQDSCIGPVVSDGKVVNTGDSQTKATIFGIQKSKSSVVIGQGLAQTPQLSTQQSTQHSDWHQLISGQGWLVHKGESHISSSVDLDLTSDFVLEKAPRTAIGIYANSSLLLVQVDGIEDENIGFDLYELTTLLLSQGVVEAINLDGGGSSVSVKDGKVISRPTSNDSADVRERSVTSILCVK